MLKGQRKINIAGSASCISLLLLAFLLVNPLVKGSVSALEGASESATQTEVDAGRVEISFTPTEVSGEMTPTTEAGLKKQLEARVKVAIDAAENYGIYLGTETPALVGVNTGEMISSITTPTSYNELPTNTWGIYWGEGEVAVPVNALYKPAEMGRGTSIGAGGKVFSTLETNYILGFAANINTEMPADTYQNKITLSVLSSPLVVTKLGDLGELQGMTPEVCEASEVGDTAQLKDVRDGKYYWVAKLADEKCWMTQNLDLDLSEDTLPLTPATSDIASEWTPKNGSTTLYTASIASSATILANDTGQRSWSLGDYKIINPTVASDCGYPKNDASQCKNQFTAYDIPVSANGDENAHYLLGNHYQWNAATAGTGGTITSGQAVGSICPKGWRLPTALASGDFQELLTAGNIGVNVPMLTSAPYYDVRGGYVAQDSSLFEAAGSYGFYWSSTPASSTGTAYALHFGGSNSTTASYVTTRRFGFSVRCIAR